MTTRKALCPRPPRDNGTYPTCPSFPTRNRGAVWAALPTHPLHPANQGSPKPHPRLTISNKDTSRTTSAMVCVADRRVSENVPLCLPVRVGGCVPTLARFVRSWPGMSLGRRFGDHAWDFSIEISGPTTGDADTPFGCPYLLPRSRFPCQVLLNTLITALCVRQLITGVDVDRVPFHRAPV
jgi:hypothetical protein